MSERVAFALLGFLGWAITLGIAGLALIGLYQVVTWALSALGVHVAVSW